MDIGEHLRTARRAAGLTQEGVARRAGLTLKAIGEVERGEVQDPHYSTLSSIAQALDMSVAELVGEEAALAPKAEAPPEMGPREAWLPGLLERALDAVRQDTEKMQRAVNRLSASEGVLGHTHITGFETDEVGRELREAGFSDDHVEEFIWPLVETVVSQEREISRLAKVEEVSGAALEIAEEVASRAEEIAEEVPNAAREAAQRVASQAGELVERVAEIQKPSEDDATQERETTNG